MRMASYMISFIWSPSSRAKENACIHSMAGEASSSSWWEIPATSVSTHDSINKWPPPSRRYSSPYDQDPASSFTNIPGLSMSSSSANISSEPVQSQLWNQALFYDGITIKGETNDQHQETSINSKLCPNELLWTGTRSLSDGISFTGCLNKPLLEGSASSNRRNGRTFTATSEGKRKRPDYSSEILLKKSKHENSTASSTKAPKMKLTDKITALQQLVSPFGKTDTASVLFETYNCIKILHEQVQLLSDPYIKSSGSKDHSGWGEMARKGIAETNLDLRSKGLCLVPISCIPEDHKENCGLDYWVPAYRTSLYR
ncbi:transcription factor bHLH110-like isoform X3 [Zingiber officinale]|uniref:transcription factor bHLH110-like isoform X3 n=1 Tax=Zingiber officinale TaxID=94328 RepID=UPI001C4CAC37|nr:transcription factor bHLH110-like isoform X3 [Zingiber officinale]